MATSGNTISQLTRDQILNASLRKLGVLSQGQTANATQLSTGAEALNNTVVEFQTLGMPLWARKTLVVTLVANQATYTIGVGLTINTPFPLRVYQATMQVPNSGSQIDLQPSPLYNFALYPTTSKGPPVVYNYTPKINQGVLSVWPTPDTSVPTGTTITLQYQAPFEVFDATANTPDFPQEWRNALIYQVAISLAPEYTIPVPTMQWIEKQAAMHLETAMSNMVEEGSLFFQIDTSGH